jgi:hypothetical protein
MPEKHALANRLTTLNLRADRLERQLEAETRYRRWQAEHPDG